MIRISGKMMMAVAVLAIAGMMVESALAQRGGGGGGGGRGRGGGGFGGGRGMEAVSTVQLAANPQVQAALNFTDEQKTAVAEVNDQLRTDRRALMEQSDGSFNEIRPEMAKLNEAAAAKVAAALDAAQNKRLLGVSIQVNGAAALHDPVLAKELNVSEEQAAKLVEARDSNREAQRDSRDELADLPREEQRAKREELRAAADKNLLAVLSTEQQAQYEALKGEPIEIELRGMRGGFGGGREGRGGEGGRGRGGRGGGDQPN